MWGMKSGKRERRVRMKEKERIKNERRKGKQEESSFSKTFSIFFVITEKKARILLKFTEKI